MSAVTVTANKHRYTFSNVPRTLIVSIAETFMPTDGSEQEVTERVLMSADTAAQLLAALPALIAAARETPTLPSVYHMPPADESKPRRVEPDAPEFLAFIATAQLIVNEHYDNMNYSAALTRPRIEFEAGPRYIRVIRTEDNGRCHEYLPNNEACPLTKEQHTRATGHTYRVLSRSAHAFIDRDTGNILKPDGWKKPARGVRGNIFKPDNGANALTPHGTVYHR